jgi:hypothetical protein
MHDVFVLFVAAFSWWYFIHFVSSGILDKERNAEALLSSNKVPMYTGFREGINISVVAIIIIKM